MARYTPLIKVEKRSPFQSSRGGAHPTLIVMHATVSHNRKGVADLQAIANWFSDPRARVSSHVCVDNEGQSARFVLSQQSAWHCAAYNRMSCGIEQILPADGSELTQAMYQEAARWVARWSRMYNIPIRQGAVAVVNGVGRVTVPGVIRHSQLGVLGGNHGDPGPYDMGAMLKYAQFYRTKIGPPYR